MSLVSSRIREDESLESMSNLLACDDVPNLAPLSDSSASSSIDFIDDELLDSSEFDCVQVGGLETTLPIESTSRLTCDLGMKKKHVSFGSLEVRKYPIVLGDHPDCSMGPPVRSLSLAGSR